VLHRFAKCSFVNHADQAAKAALSRVSAHSETLVVDDLAIVARRFFDKDQAIRMAISFYIGGGSSS
jgi:hypothetical protein